MATPLPSVSSLPTQSQAVSDKDFIQDLIQRGVIPTHPTNLPQENWGSLREFCELMLQENKDYSPEEDAPLIQDMREDYSHQSLRVYLKTGQRNSEIPLENPSPLMSEVSNLTRPITIRILGDLYKSHPEAFLHRRLDEQRAIIGLIDTILYVVSNSPLFSYIISFHDSNDECHDWTWNLRSAVLTTAQNRLDLFSDLMATKLPLAKKEEIRTLLSDLPAIKDKGHESELEKEKRKKIQEILAPCFEGLPIIPHIDEIRKCVSATAHLSKELEDLSELMKRECSHTFENVVAWACDPELGALVTKITKESSALKKMKLSFYKHVPSVEEVAAYKKEEQEIRSKIDEIKKLCDEKRVYEKEKADKKSASQTDTI